MENTKLYIVSFGNSKQYLLKDTKSGEKSALAKIEKNLNDYLREQFPDDSFTYYTSPKVSEVDPSHESEYRSYQKLDDNAISAIKSALVREVRDMNSTKELNEDAPYSNVNPAAADISGILG